MSGNLQADQLKAIEEVQKKKLLQIERDTIHENLTKLQTWTPVEGQTLAEQRQAYKESMIRGQLQENAAMQATAQSQLAQAQARAAAPGAPVQEQAPAKLTYKQRREQARKAREAKKRCPVGTADTYDCAESISRVLQERKTSLDRGVPEDTGGIDPKVMGAFCQGYKVNKKGRPATPEDQAKADSDTAFFNAYLSKELDQRKPYLETFRKELMDFPLSRDSVSDAYIIKNVETLKRVIDKACYYENLMRDPINKPYFDSLSPADAALLKKKLDILADLGKYFINFMGGMGVDSNMGGYYGPKQASAISTYQRISEALRESTIASTAGWKQQKEEILRPYMEADAAQEREQILRGIEEDRVEQMENLPEDMNFSTPAVGYATEELKRYRAMIEAHPAAYKANRQLIDQLYHEVYRGLDLINEIAMDSLVYKSVAMVKDGSPIDTEQVKADLANAKQMQFSKSTDSVRKKVDVVALTLEFCLGERPLTDDIRAFLTKTGQSEAAIAQMEWAYKERRVQKVFLGENGVVADSNKALKSAVESGQAPSEIRSSALQALGIRNSKTAAAKANSVLCDEIYMQLPLEIAQKFRDLDAQDTDFANIQQQMNKAYLSSSKASGYVTGGGVDAVNEALLTLYGTYLNSEQSVRYLKFMCETLKGAEIFSGNSGEMLAFLSQSLLNTFGANFIEVDKAKNSYKNGSATRTVALEACRTMLSLPAMARVSQEEWAELPEATQKLAEQYKALLRQVRQKVDSAAAES